MDLRRDFLFPVIIWVVIQRDFILGGQAGFNDGSLILNSGDVLEINTTVPSMIKRKFNGFSFNATHKTTPHSVKVACVTFRGNVELKKGSIINVTGKYALSITSQNGSIIIQTDINMVCNEEDVNISCLGGFTQSSQASIIKEGRRFYHGLGPGSLKVFSNLDSVALQRVCLPGSNHGGKVMQSSFQVGDPYNKKNLTFRGGSGGSCVDHRKGVAGGGAIELVSKFGCISIDASIRASAQSSSSGTLCSGGSGGLIRLVAQQVEILGNGRLIVDGGNGTTSDKAIEKAGGGAGGVIQIISPVGNLSADSLFLRHGTSSSKADCEENPRNANGYYYLQACNIAKNGRTFPEKSFLWNKKPHSTHTCNITGDSRTFPELCFSWKKDPHSSHTITSSSTTSQFYSSVASPTTPSSKGHYDVKELTMRLRHVRSSTVKWNDSAIREVISMHKNLTASNVLSKKTVRALCLESFIQYRDIADNITERDPEFPKEPLQGIIEIASNCIEEKTHPVWKKDRLLPELMQTLEDTLVISLRGSGSTEVKHVIVSSNVVAQVVRESPTANMTNITISNFSVVEGDSWKNVTDFLVIPSSTVMKAKENYTYVFVLFKDVANALPRNTVKKHRSVSSVGWEVSSLLMSCFLMLDNVPVKDLSPPARLTFHTSVFETSDKQCFFWDNNESYWSAEGIKVVSSVKSELTVCETNHFTSFAVLIKPRATELSHSDKLALSIITYVGCGVSTVALALTLIVFLSIESLSADRHKIHTNLVLSLLLAQVLFLAGIRETSNQVVCKIIAVLMHYFYLTAFTWMLVEGLHLYLKVVQVFKTENVKVLYYCVFGWGFAIIPVGITTAVKPNNYGNSDICWLSLEDGTVWAFIGPVIAIITVNSIVLFMVIKTVVTSAASIKSCEYDHIKAGIKGLFVLMPILGVGWILGLFAVNKATVVFEYAFALVNGFQGLFIFLLHCAFNNEVSTNSNRAIFK